MQNPALKRRLLWIALLVLLVSFGAIHRASQESPPAPPAAPIAAASATPAPSTPSEPAAAAPGLAAHTPPAAAAPSGGATKSAAAAVFRLAGPSAGKPLVPGSADFVREQLAGRRPVGRVTPVDSASWVALRTLRVGDAVLLPLAEGEAVEATIRAVMPRPDGTASVAGHLTQGGPGAFTLVHEGGRLSGFILIHAKRLAYKIETDPSGAQVIRELPLGDVICDGLRPAPGEAAPAPGFAAALTPAIPVLNSRPTATATLYLDFDGEVATDPLWGASDTSPINAPAFAGITDAIVTDLFNRVKEDYIPFNVNVTTERAKYDNATDGNRMHCIITPSKQASQNIHPGEDISSILGEAYTNTFVVGSGRVCWVYTIDAIYGSLSISHELGHTLGLHHDNNGSSFGYYTGHGGSGPTSWCPIMGSSGIRQVTQWSMGEYLGSTQGEDDLAIISAKGNYTNNFGYVTDEAGDTPVAAAPIAGGGSSFSRSGVITTKDDIDFYSFITSGGPVTITATPASPSPNLDIALELQNSGGAVLASSNPADALTASLTASLSPGTYYVKIKGTGVGNPTVNPPTGYTSYGSIGAYTLAGTGAFLDPLKLTSFTPASGQVGSAVTLTGTGFTLATEVKFNGKTASFTPNSATQITATVPAFATTGPLTVTSPSGTVSSTSNFTVSYPAPAITSFTPTAGSIFIAVTITGTNLAYTTAVRFNGTAAEFEIISSTQLKATVPAGVTNGTISVTTAGGATTTSAGSFSVNNGSSGTWSVLPWTGDDATGIPQFDTDEVTLRSAVHFGSSANATVKTRTVTGVAGSSGGSSYIQVSGATQYTNASNNLTIYASTGSSLMAESFWYGNDPLVVLLSNLVPGKIYRLSLFSVGWESSGRVSDFGSGSDHLSVDQDQYGTGNGIRVDYHFTASTATQTITVYAANSGFTWHNHAIALMEVQQRAPLVGARTATSVTATSAVLRATVNGYGLSTPVKFKYGYNSNLNLSLPATPSPVAGWYDTDVSATVTGLFGHTVYQFQAEGTNALGTTSGSTLSFTTPNRAPVANSLSLTVNEDDYVYAALPVSDADGDSMTPSVVTAPTHGTVQLLSDLSIYYSPTPNYSGSDSFSYKVADGFGGTSSTRTVSITVTAVNDPPTIDDMASVTINEDAGQQTVTLTGITRGAANETTETLTVTATSSDPALIPNPTVTYTSPNATGTLTYEPAANATGRAAITVVVSDGTATSTTAFGVTVNAVNDVPSFALPAGGAPGVDWTARESNRNWQSIASSAYGTKLAAVVYGGQIYTSTDSGVSWTARMTDANRNWQCIASSADGTKLAAGVNSAGQIYTSTDSGVTWTAQAGAGSNNWQSIASSDNGTKLAAVAYPGKIYTSTDSGVTWTARASTLGWQSIASSADGTNLAAVVNNAQIYTSTNSGVTWTARAGAPTLYWRSIASSADGTKLVAAANGDRIYTSTNSGVSWTARDTARFWYSVASSIDGTKLAAVVQSGQIYTSINSGLTWTAQAGSGSRDWRTITSSADGTKLAAGVNSSGQIYTSAPFPYGLSAAANSGVNSVAAFATNISPGPANEAAQTLSFNLLNDNNALFTAQQPAIASNGTLSFTPNPSATGTATVTVTAQDNGGTANGGVDTSEAQTFTITVTASAPTVTTPTVTNITATGATLGGNVTATGGSAITERGVVYALTSANANPTIGGTGVAPKLTATGLTGVFTVNAAGLSANSLYSFRAYATNALGTAYTTDVTTFTTLPLPPVVAVNGGGGAAVFSAAGNLATARGYHTASVLGNGKVLVAGGRGSGGVDLASAELYNPATNTWSVTGSLVAAHYAPTASVLGNGKVLLVGGYNPTSGFLASAELYDPASNTWSPAGSLATGRYQHAASVLSNGKVLVVGGNNASGFLVSAELYDPATNSWSSGGSLVAARAGLAAGVLANGKVLVTGGNGPGGHLASAEVYDPASNAWSPAGSLATARSYHTASVLGNGKVLVAGGTNGSSLASAELYDPASNSWSPAGSLATARAYHTVSVLGNGKVLVVGGQGTSSYLASAELYDPAANTWSAAGSLATARYIHTATLLANGKVLVAGGYNGNYLASAELYGSPTVVATGAEGAVVTQAGTFSDPDGNATVTLTASSGTVTQNNAAGTWSWSPAAGFDGPSTTAVTITATDTASATATAAFTFSPTNTAPTVAISAPASANEDAPVSFTFTATDAATADQTAGFSWSLNYGDGTAAESVAAGTASPLAGSHTFANPGTFTVTATATDKDAGVSSAATRSITILDVTPPDTTITSGTPATASTTATISFTGTDNVAVTSFEGRLDGAAFAPVTSPLTLSALTDGSHTFDVRAKDAAGNVDPTPASVTWTVDTTAPVVTPPGNVTMHATSPAGAVVNYGVATATDAVTASPAITYSKASNTLFAPGTTTVTVTATDAAGNAGTATFTVTVTPLTPAENWRYANFGTAANTGAAAGTADADGDGKTNAVELAFGTDPNNAGSGPGALTFTGTFAGGGTIGQRGQPIVRAEGTDRRALFMRRIDYAAAGLTYAVEFTGDLTTWEASTETPVTLASDGVYEIVSVPYPSFVSGKEARYFRVRVTLAP